MKNSDTTTEYDYKIIDDIIGGNLDPSCRKLIERTLGLKEKYKALNDELKEIMQIDKDIKIKEVMNDNKKIELMNIERRMKETGAMYDFRFNK
jgi:hypothetical protein